MSKNNSKLDQQINKALFRNYMGLFMILVKSSVFILCFLLLFGIFGDSMSGIFHQAQPISEEVQKKNRKARALANPIDEDEKVENGIHVQTGLAFAEGFEIVRGTCTACHSAKLVTQNRATRDGWKEMIRWMQKTQGLWDLGKNEPIILDYLAKHYAPEEIERRPSLNIAEIEWYILDLTSN